MHQKKLTGPQAGSLKYDLLTAISVAGLHGSPTLQTSMARLSLVITARYNWRLDEVSIGQTELARMWGVNERTVKREMKRLTESGVLTCVRPGVRGRVGAYRLNYARIYAMTEPHWASIGSDFVDRMAEIAGRRTVVKVDFAAKTQVEKPAHAVPGTWAAVKRRLQINHPDLFGSWFSKLTEAACLSDRLELKAPNRFVAGYISNHLSQMLSDAVRAEMGAGWQVSIQAPQ